MASPESGIRGKGMDLIHYAEGTILFWFAAGCYNEVISFFSTGNIRLADPAREFGSSGFGNVAWKERIDGWKIKPEKNAVPMSVSNAPSEGRGGGDFDASTDVVMDDSIL